MLTNFSVKNFRNFSDWYQFSLQSKKQYEFNTECVRNGIVKTSVIYGLNGVGKSNLGLAILDITNHITDTPVAALYIKNYLNERAINNDEIAEFKYEFDLNGNKVEYCCGKKNPFLTIYEVLKINGEQYIKLDKRINNTASIRFSGTESLKKDFTDAQISVVKYIKSNAILDDNAINKVFYDFIDYVSKMVYFKAHDSSVTIVGQGLVGSRLSTTIIEAGYLPDFEKFLNDAGIKCKLATIESDGEKLIAFAFNEKVKVEFTLAASSGTKVLIAFFYQWLKLSRGELKFAYVDEFDAYYHYALAKLIVDKLKGIDVQTVLTTHNLSILSNDILRPDCYFLMAEKQYPFYELVDKELRKAHNLEKIFKGLRHEYEV